MSMFRNFNSQNIFGKEYRRFSRTINYHLSTLQRNNFLLLKADSIEWPLEQQSTILSILLLLLSRGAAECFVFSFQNVFMNFFLTISMVLRSPFRIIWSHTNTGYIWNFIFLKKYFYIGILQLSYLFHYCFLFML